MKQLLIKRSWDIPGNWYAPKDFLQQFKSVKYVELLNTSSSAGDWDGLVFQVLNKRCYVIPFSQNNNYPSDGFELLTGDVICKTTDDFDKDLIISQYAEMYY